MLDSSSEYQPQTDASSSDIVTQQRYNLRTHPNRRLNATDSSTPNFSALSSNTSLRFLRQHAQPFSDSKHSSESVPQFYFTSGVDTASFISSDVQFAYFSGNLFSVVLIPTAVALHVRIPECFTPDHSRPPTPNFADYSIRVGGTTIYDPPSKEHMFQRIEQLHIISTKNNLILAPENSFFMLLNVKFLGHEMSYNTIQPIHSKTAAIHIIPSPTGKVALSLVGALIFLHKNY